MENDDEYEDEFGRIWPKIKLTPYDRRLKELRDLQAKRDMIIAKEDKSEGDQRRLAVLDFLIKKASEKFQEESRRALDDGWRRRRMIDVHRAEAGKDDYNAKRRFVRSEPNANLSDLSAEQKKQRKLDQTADSKWLKRKREAGIPEQVIQAQLAARIRKREAERGNSLQSDPGSSHAEVDPE